MIDDIYVHLKTAILEQAVKDYRTALKRNDTYLSDYLERWFMSGWGEFLSNNSGAFIVEKVKKQVEEWRAKMEERKIKKENRYQNAEHCICCDAVIPEGRQVCPKCESGVAVNG